MYRLHESRVMNAHDAARLVKRAQVMLSTGWLVVKPANEGYVVVRISTIQELPEIDEVGGWIRKDYPLGEK